MKKKLYSMVFLLALAFSARAAETQWCLVVENAVGVKTAIGMSQKPIITTNSSGYELSYGAFTANFAWNELKTMTIENREPSVTGIKEVSVQPFKLSPNEIAMSNMEPGTKVQVFSISGRQEMAVSVQADGSVTLSTAGLPAGIYIVKSNKSSFKITKK